MFQHLLPLQLCFNWLTEFEIYLKNSSHWFFHLNLTEFRDLKYNQLLCAFCLEKAFRQLQLSLFFCTES
uniref:Uncharacterized protein n=1 Tax=Salix viminalis TaxID=40686 RepID=A0A6N2NFK6_SALVM